MKEWPLIVFTLAIQAACALAAAATACDFMLGRDAGLARPLGLATFPLIAIGILASAAHLGRPLHAWRALVNWRTSRLSREIVFTGVFALSALVQGALWLGPAGQGRLAAGVAATLCGFAAVVSAAMVYRVPAQAAWNSAWVPVSFLGTTLLFAGICPALLRRWDGDHEAVLRVFLGAAVAGSGLVLGGALLMPARTEGRRWMGLHIALAALVPAGVAIAMWPPGSLAATPVAIGGLVAAVCGAATGRAIMYQLRSKPQRPAGFD